MLQFKDFGGSHAISGLPPVHYGSFLSNFEDVYSKKDPELYPKLHAVVTDLLSLEVKKHPRYIFLCGTPGNGKTHFLVGLYRAMIAKIDFIQGDGATFITYATLTQEMISLFKDNTPLRLGLAGYLESRWLFIDDFTSSERILKEGALEQTMMRDILIDRYDKQKTLITSSNLNREDFMKEMGRLFGSYISSRLNDSLIIQFPAIDLRREA